VQFREASQRNPRFFIATRGPYRTGQQIEHVGFIAIHFGRLLQVAHGFRIVVQLQPGFAKIKIVAQESGSRVRACFRKGTPSA
jgi:hypothetical protein